MTETRTNVDVLNTVPEGHAATAVGVVAGPASPPVIVATSSDMRKGTVLINSNTRLPEAVPLESKQYGRWKVLSQEDGLALERSLSSIGWHFFFVVPEILSRALSFYSGNALRAALKKLFAAVEAQDLNGLEIVEIVRRRFLGFHYVRVVAHPRHVKDSPFLRDLDPHHIARNTWNFKGVLRRRAQVGVNKRPSKISKVRF
jgi:hypothetical protein